MNLFGQKVKEHIKDKPIRMIDLPKIIGLSQGTIYKTFNDARPIYDNVILIINALELETMEYLRYAGLL